MDRRMIVAGGAAACLVALSMVAFVLLSPGWAVGALNQMAGAKLGRPFTSEGGAHLQFSPLAIVIDAAALAGPSETADRLMTAKSLTIPVSLGELLGRRPALTRISLKEPEFALLIDERGEASWDFPEANAAEPVTLLLEGASFRYFDARNAQSLSLGNVNGEMTLAPGGRITFNGSAVINSHVARIDLELKSLPRINADGSPLELAIETENTSANFSGRLSTAQVLSLAGPVSITSEEPADAARWAGLPLPDGFALPGPLNLDGALDSAGRAYAIRNASVTFGQFRGGGDVVADLRGDRPKLQANLRADTVWLDSLVPEAGAANGEWGRKPLPFALLRSFDAEVSLLARAAAFGTFSAGASRLAATLADGKLKASGAFRLDEGGTASFTFDADATALPPALGLTVQAENAGMESLLGTLSDTAILSGMGNASAALTAQGQTEEELIGTLKGTVKLSLTKGRLAGIDLGGLVTAVGEKIVDGWSAAPGGTPLDSLAADLTLADGVATVTSASLTAAPLTISLSGNADLLRRALDLKAALGPPEAAPLPVPVVVRGAWSAPRIYPDIPDILNNPEGGYARLRTPETPPNN